MDKILIPIIRQKLSASLVADLVGVQPMTDAGIFTLKFREAKGEPMQPYQGQWCHDFIRGYLRYYGTEWIPERVWIKLKIKGL